MASCLNLAGYSKGCDRSIGGIQKVALFARTDVDLTSYTVTNGQVSGLTLIASGSGYTYDFLRDNSNFTQPIVGDGILANVHWEPTITLVFKRMSLALRNEVYNMGAGELVAIIKDWNDEYWVFGLERGLLLSASAGSQSGNKMEELNGETVVLKEIAPRPAYYIDPDDCDAKIQALF